MFPVVLAFHSFIRWLLLILLGFAVWKGYIGWKKQSTFSRFNHTLSLVTASAAIIQFIIGAWLYFKSPLVGFFLENFTEAVHMRDNRFFGMEHSFVMTLAIIIIVAGVLKAGKKTDSAEKFRIIAIWFGIGLLLILSSIPWSFSPFTSRPNFRF